MNTSRAWNGRQCWAQHKGDENAGISSQTTGSRSTRHLGVGPGMGKGDSPQQAGPSPRPAKGGKQTASAWVFCSQVLTGWTPLPGQMLAGNFFDYQPIRESTGSQNTRGRESVTPQISWASERPHWRWHPPTRAHTPHVYLGVPKA